MKLRFLFLVRLGSEIVPDTLKICAEVKKQIEKYASGGEPFAAQPLTWGELDPVTHHVYPIEVSKPETYHELKKLSREFRMAFLDCSKGPQKTLESVGLVAIGDKETPRPKLIEKPTG